MLNIYIWRLSVFRDGLKMLYRFFQNPSLGRPHFPSQNDGKSPHSFNYLNIWTSSGNLNSSIDTWSSPDSSFKMALIVFVSEYFRPNRVRPRGDCSNSDLLLYNLDFRNSFFIMLWGIRQVFAPITIGNSPPYPHFHVWCHVKLIRPIRLFFPISPGV